VPDAARADVVTFGCRLNISESEAMADMAARAGLRDAVIVNTCTVTAAAVKEAGQAIRRLKREQPVRPIIVTGCAAQVEPARFAAMPEVARVIGNDEKMRPETWAGLVGSNSLAAGLAGEGRMLVGDIMQARTAPGWPSPKPADRTRAFIQVQNGCDHRCTFCVIPLGRGNSRSLPVAHVAEQAARLVDEGVKEIVLTGVDVTSYGMDLLDDPGFGRPTLGRLVKAVLAAAPGLPRLRLSSIDAVEADDDLRDAFANEPRLMPHLHLSLQSGDDLILKRMKRRHSRTDVIRFCAEMRSIRPDMAFGADLIAGFPTEDEAMFARSIDLIGDCGLSFVHVFPYSSRPGTPAARMPQLSGEVVRERAARLREAAAAALSGHLAGYVGRTLPVLTERGGTGRTEGFAKVRLPSDTPAGELRRLTITGHDGAALIAA
jgi:threonylcarbamoyladenosine tRNA methylthiotransferase MtaB